MLGVMMMTDGTGMRTKVLRLNLFPSRMMTAPSMLIICTTLVFTTKDKVRTMG